jgi:hypothetical protein
LNRHRSIIKRVLWPLSYTARLVDPTGLKPAPHGLKGRRSVTRAPGQEIGCGGRIRTFDSRINNPVPYQLGYATRGLAAATRVELVSSRLQDERSVIQLSYAAIWWTGRDSNPHKKFAGLLCCRLHHQPERIWWLRVESNHQPRAYETLALIPFELHSHILEAREGVEPRAFPPSSCRFGLEDRCRERGP